MSITKSLKQSMKSLMTQETKGYSTQATVIRIDGDTAWVHIPGGVNETPVQRTVSAKPGDTVNVRVEGGGAWIAGNKTAPPTDDSAVAAMSDNLMKIIQNAIKRDPVWEIREGIPATTGSMSAGSTRTIGIDYMAYLHDKYSMVAVSNIQITGTNSQYAQLCEFYIGKSHAGFDMLYVKVKNTGSTANTWTLNTSALFMANSAKGGVK